MNTFLQVMLGIGGFVGGIAYAYGQWKDRRNGSRFDTVKLFKDQIDAMELKINTQQDDIKKLTEEIHSLKIEISEKDKKVSELLTVLQGRDPAMQDTLLAFKEYMEAGKPVITYFSQKLPSVLERVEKFLDKQSF